MTRDYTRAPDRRHGPTCEECGADEATTHDHDGRCVCGWCAREIEQRILDAADEAMDEYEQKDAA